MNPTVERGCFGKRRYSTQLQARIQGDIREGLGAPKLRVYSCRFCQGYHLTKGELFVDN